jgi:hypothetical protein
VYLLFITAITIIYFEPPFERRWEHRLGCYSVPVIVTAYWLVNLNGMLFKTVIFLWLFTTLYYIFLHAAIWKVMEKDKKHFDSFGYAYLMAVRNLK